MRVASEADTIVARTLRGAWPSLPALLTASAALCVAATIPLLAAPGINAVAVVLYAVLAPPPLIALVAVANAVTVDDGATIRGWYSALRSQSGFAVRQGLLVAVPTELFLAALQVWSRGHPLWALPSLALTGAACVLAICGMLAALPLGLARPTLRGPLLWIAALHLVARRPIRFAAVFSLAGLGLWTAIRWSASLLLLVPAPTALVLVAAVWTTVTEMSRGSVTKTGIAGARGR